MRLVFVLLATLLCLGVEGIAPKRHASSTGSLKDKSLSFAIDGSAEDFLEGLSNSDDIASSKEHDVEAGLDSDVVVNKNAPSSEKAIVLNGDVKYSSRDLSLIHI